MRVAGRIKWFDSAKGYGFIVLQHDADAQAGVDGDIMLHISCLRDYGESSADEGAEIICEVALKPRGWQAVRIIEMARPKVALAQEAGSGPDYEQVTLKWFNRVRGYGFVLCEGSDEDIFIHAVVLRQAGYDEVEPGTRIEAVIGAGVKGRHVLLVRPSGQVRSALAGVSLPR